MVSRMCRKTDGITLLYKRREYQTAVQSLGSSLYQSFLDHPTNFSNLSFVIPPLFSNLCLLCINHLLLLLNRPLLFLKCHLLLLNRLGQDRDQGVFRDPQHIFVELGDHLGENFLCFLGDETVDGGAVGQGFAFEVDDSQAFDDSEGVDFGVADVCFALDVGQVDELERCPVVAD
jgi:hypothetical protein